jgi:hypothetical protein
MSIKIDSSNPKLTGALDSTYSPDRISQPVLYRIDDKRTFKIKSLFPEFLHLTKRTPVKGKQCYRISHMTMFSGKLFDYVQEVWLKPDHEYQVIQLEGSSRYYFTDKADITDTVSSY